MKRNHRHSSRQPRSQEPRQNRTRRVRGQSKVGKTLRKAVLLVLLFAVSAAVFIFWTHRTREDEVRSGADESSRALPVVELAPAGTYINMMQGHVDEMSARYMRDTITPVSQSLEMKMRITEYGDPVKTVSYEIRSLDLTQLVDRVTVDTFNEKTLDDGRRQLVCDAGLKNLLVEDQEYIMKITLSTQAHEQVSYYTRLIWGRNLRYGDMIDFIQDFHYKTIHTDQASGMATYLKTRTDNSDSLARVSLGSSYKKLLWNYLDPEQKGTSRIRLTDISSAGLGTFTMDSRMRMTAEDGSVHPLAVREVYTVQIVEGRKYLLDYSRSVSEMLDESPAEESGYLELGIQDEEELDHIVSASGNNILFSARSGIWLEYKDNYDKGNLRLLYGSNNYVDASNPVLNNYSVKLVSAEDNGDVSFLLYGYISRGSHEGQTGIIYYTYNYEENMLNERFFMPYTRSADLLEKSMGRLAYITDTGLFYMMMDGNLYAIDFAGRECLMAASDITESTIVTSKDNSVIAWEEGRHQGGADRIRVFYLESGRQNVIEAEDGEYLRAIGFIESDLAVGRIKKGHYKKYRSEVSRPMYAVQIYDENNQVVSSYQKSKILVTGTAIGRGSITLKRMLITSSGLAETSDDALIENMTPPAAAADVLISTSAAAGYPVWRITTGQILQISKVISVEQVAITDSSYLTISAKDDTLEKLYFAYAGSELKGFYTSAASAVKKVYASYGYVVDSNGSYCLRRGYHTYSMTRLNSTRTETGLEERKYLCLKVLAEYEGGSYEESLPALAEEGLTDAGILAEGLKATGLKVNNLKGCSLQQIAWFYLGNGHPIFAQTPDGPVLIKGIGNSKVFMWDPASAETVSLGITEAEAMFEEAGNVFIACMR